MFASAVCRVQPCSSRRLRRLGLWGPYPLISLFPFLPGACHFPPPSASPASSDSVSRVSETFPGTCSSVTTLSPLPLPLEMLLYLKTSICSCAFVRAPLAVCLRLCSHVNAPQAPKLPKYPVLIFKRMILKKDPHPHCSSEGENSAFRADAGCFHKGQLFSPTQIIADK